MNECSSPVGTLQGTEPRRVKRRDVAHGGRHGDRSPGPWSTSPTTGQTMRERETKSAGAGGGGNRKSLGGGLEIPLLDLPLPRTPETESLRESSRHCYF